MRIEPRSGTGSGIFGAFSTRSVELVAAPAFTVTFAVAKVCRFPRRSPTSRLNR